MSTGVLGESVLDMAFLDATDLLVLSPDALSLYRLEDADLRLLDREPLPGPHRPVRAPGGLVVLADGAAFCWALTSGMPRAALFTVSRQGLDLQSDAAAVPWPNVPGGVRFRRDTNLLEADMPGLEGPLLRLLPGDEPMAVGARGELRMTGRPASSLRLGPALAPLWPGLVGAASPLPPGASDEVLVFTPSAPPEVIARFGVPGAVRALAARALGRKRMLAAAIEAPDVGFRIVFIELAESGS